VVAADRGSGIVDVASALDASPRSHGSLGVGIGAVRRLATDVDFDVRLGEGTRIAARIFSREAPRQREVGVYGRPIEGETLSGDHACLVRDGDVLVLAVCDGLGHGQFAREAADAAIGAVYANASQSPVGILHACHTAVHGSRGVVMAVARVPQDTSTVENASIGNIEVQICGPRALRRFGGSSAVVGGKTHALPRPRSETAVFHEAELLIMTTDGVSSKMSIAEELTLLREHPIAIAQRIVEGWGRTTDDVLVLVAR
jgi:hypothetical protein